MEIVSRPQPREGGEPRRRATTPRRGSPRSCSPPGRGGGWAGPTSSPPRSAGGRWSRIAAEAALASRADPVVVVTGHEPDKVRAALAGLDVRFVHNPDYADGLSTSLRRGIAALPEDVDGAVVLLADMPGVDAAVVDRLIAAFDPAGGHADRRADLRGQARQSGAVVAAALRRAGHRRRRHRRPPPRSAPNADAVAEVEIGPAVALDVDTPEALAAAGGKRRADGPVSTRRGMLLIP